MPNRSRFVPAPAEATAPKGDGAVPGPRPLEPDLPPAWPPIKTPFAAGTLRRPEAKRRKR